MSAIAEAPAAAGHIPPAPVGESERLTLIDSLRGFALAGVYLVNLPGFMLISTLTPAEEARLPLAWAAPAIDHFVSFFISGKAITLFSLLFGIGFAIQMERADKRGADITPLYVRRLAILFGIGVAHSLIFMDDILHDYALLGLTLLLFRRASDAVLIGVGLAAAAIAQPLLDVYLRSRPEAPMLTQALDYGALVLRHGDVWQALRANFDLLVLSVGNLREPLLFVFGRLLLGFWIGRSRLLHEPDKNRERIGWLFLWSFAIGVGAQLIASGYRHILPSSVVDAMLDRMGGLALGFSYAMGFALLFQLPRWRKRLEFLAPAGRMALSNYLMQTLISIPIFYGFGLGVGPVLGWPGLFGTFAIVYVGQLFFSRWWLERYRFGPAEWAWRSLTYGKAQKLRRQESKSPTSIAP